MPGEERGVKAMWAKDLEEKRDRMAGTDIGAGLNISSQPRNNAFRAGNWPQSINGMPCRFVDELLKASRNNENGRTFFRRSIRSSERADPLLSRCYSTRSASPASCSDTNGIALAQMKDRY